MHLWHRLILSISLLTSCYTQLWGQLVELKFWRDSISTVAGATFTNRLTIRNISTQKQEFILSPQIPPSVQLLSTIPERVLLTPGEMAMVPIKGLVNNQTSTPTNQFTVQVSDISGHVLTSKPFQLILKGKTQPPVSLYAPEETIVLYSTSEEVHLPLRLIHNHIRQGKFFIEVASMPEGVERLSSPFLIQLAPSQDTTLSIRVNPSRHWSTDQPYQLVITLRDAQKTVVGNVVYKLVVAVGYKRFIDAGYNGPRGYGVSAALTRFSTNQLAKETRVWGTDSLGKGQVDFQIHYLNYGSNHLQQLQNSFISFRTDRAMVRLGSLYDFHELPLFGRGLKVNIGQPDQQWTFWAVNANPNWLSPDQNAWTGNIFSVRYDRQLPSLPGGSWSASSSYFTQANTMRTGYLNFATFRYDRAEHHSLQILGGQSVEFAPRGPDRAQTFGWAGQLNYTYQRPMLSWQLRSYISSPVYSGLQKGATLVYSQLFWQPSTNTTLLARINYLRYNRLSFTSAVDTYRHVFGNTVAEIILSQRVNRLSFGLRPYWFSQSDFSNPFSQRADAYRFAPSLSYNRRSGQRFDLSYDVGMFYDRTTGLSQPGFISERVVTSMSMGSFNFWGYWQRGPYYLFDLRNNRPDQIMTASLTPTIDFALLNRKLIGSAGLNYLYDAFSAESRYVAVGRVQYDVTPTFQVSLSGNGTPYSQHPEFAYSLYRLEVTKRFNQLKPKHHGQLQLSFFEDANGNGNKDSGERWMDSLLVTVNENTLLTNAKGSITYQDIPPGTYTVSAISVDRVGDPVLYHEKITVGRSVNKVVPLSLTFPVKGQLHCQTNAYERQPCQFTRFIIDVQQGQQTVASASPLPDGTFSVHLSPGDYTLLVRDYGRQQQQTVKTTSFTLTEIGKHPTFDWTIDASTRPVEIKRFTVK